MSDDNYVSLTTSLTTPSITVKCTFINYEGVEIILKESNRHTIRQLKKRIYKELTYLDLAELSPAKTDTTQEDIICVNSTISDKSSTSHKTTVSETVHTTGDQLRFCA